MIGTDAVTAPQEAIMAVRTLLRRPRPHPLHGSSLLDKVDRIIGRSKPHEENTNIPESKIRLVEDLLWAEYGLSGILVPDKLLKECQRRLRNALPDSRFKLDTKE